MKRAELAAAHLQQVLGRGGQRPIEDYSKVGDVEVVFVDDPDLDAVHVATIGLSELAITALHPTEFVCSVRPPQIEAARFLVESAVTMAVSGGGQITLDSQMTNATPLLAGTDIRGLLLSPGLWFDDLDVVEDESGKILLHVITLLPLIAADVERLDAADADAIYDRIADTTADLLDITRTEPI